MAFRFPNTSASVVDSPEAMFLDWRSRTIPGLLSHQADPIRAYAEKAAAKSDVALQLPTGSGKTLVGLILAEWRRRKYGNRALQRAVQYEPILFGSSSNHSRRRSFG